MQQVQAARVIDHLDPVVRALTSLQNARSALLGSLSHLQGIDVPLGVRGGCASLRQTARNRLQVSSLGKAEWDRR